jgi:beta-galactosidase
MKSIKKALMLVLTVMITLLNFNVHIVSAQTESKSVNVNYNGERKLSFDSSWQFNLGDVPNAQSASFDDSTWRSLDLPHDWSIELPFNQKSAAGAGGGYLDGGTGWYRKTFTLPQSMTGKKVFIDFDGVYMNSDVWINGHDLGVHPYGYTSFQYDLTPYLNFDGSANVIAVKVVNNQPTSRWYSGSGIYRNVWLEVTNPVHVDNWGTYVTTPNITTNADLTNSAEVDAATAVVNETADNQTVLLTSTVLDSNNNTVATTTSSNAIAAGGTYKFAHVLNVSDAKLWSIDTPTLYTLKTEVSIGGNVVDTYNTSFGIRSFNFDPNTGFSLNGKSMKIQGVCLHQDLGSLGSSVNYAAIYRQLQIMKSMGVNAVRTSHNPPAPELLDAADILGIMVMDEAFDMWGTSKNSNDYGKYFNQKAPDGLTWAQKDIQSMVNRDKNHASVIIWSIGNEISDTKTAAGVTTAKNLRDWVKAIDTTRPVTCAIAYWDTINTYSQQVNALMDIAGYNYGESKYDSDHAAYPNRVILGTETVSEFSSRGVYHFPVNSTKTWSDYQSSAYGTSTNFRTAEDAWYQDKNRSFVAGEFIWTGFDYIGEPTPYSWPAKSSYFGAVDTAGFPKDEYYFYKSQWTTTPMVHILPSWNWQTGQTIPVWAYTNAATVELFLNGKSLGVQTNNPNGPTFHLAWNVAYEPGTLKAVAKDKDGNVVATNEVKTAGDAAKIVLKEDRSLIKSDGQDLAFIEADVVDKDGNLVPNADNLINFTVTGGKIVGVDNGNPIDHSSYQASSRNAFSGKALVIVQSTNAAGKITVTASSAQPIPLYSNTVDVFTRPSIDSAANSIVGIKSTVVQTMKGTAPMLPKTVTAVYSDGSKKDLNVTWDNIDSSKYASIGTFTVSGAVEGTDIKAEANITVKDITAVEPIAMSIIKGTVPALPSTVILDYSDGTRSVAKVIWDNIDTSKCATVGTFVVNGAVEGTVLKAEADITVREITTVQTVQADTIYGRVPNLPAKVSVQYNDGSNDTLPVTWNTNAAQFLTTGTVAVNGTITNANMNITANVNVQGGIYLSNLTWVSSTTGWSGHNTQKDKSIDGNKLTLAGDSGTVTYSKGLGAHADSTTIYNLSGGNYSRFQCYVGQDQEISGAYDGVIFQVYLDGTKMFDSGVMTKTTLQKFVDIDVSGVTELKLVALKNGNNSEDHADWADAVLLGGKVYDQPTGQSVSVTTLVGKAPILPSTATLTYGSGVQLQSNVIWDAISPWKYYTTGTFTVNGTVAGTAVKAIANVTVTDNLALKTTGSSYPQAIASFTCQYDNVNHANDGIISYTDSPKDRWTNWVSGTQRSSDWLGIDFGQNTKINTIKLYDYTDSGSAAPTSITIQYWDGSNWMDAKNQNFDPQTPAVGLNTITFDTVTTSKVRASMIGQSGMCIGITEMEVYGPKFQLDTVTLTADKTILGLKDRAKLTLSGIMSDGAQADLSNADIKYTVDNKDVADVSAEGVVTPVNEGRANVTAAVSLNGVTRYSSFAIAVDTIAPAITVNGIKDGDVLKLNQKEPVVVTWSASDSISGVDSTTGNIPSGATLDVSKVGTYTLNFTAVDKVGNTSRKTITYYVQYDYSGLLAPINKDDSRTFKQGSTVPVKFQLKDANGVYVTNAAVKLYVAKVTNGAVEDEIAAVSTSAPSGNNFKYDSTSNQYIFNLSTKDLLAGTFQLRIDLGDGSNNVVQIKIN